MSRLLANASSVAMTGARELARLIVPVCCPGCGRDDVRWCDECEAPWWEDPYRSEENAPRLHRLGEVPIAVWSIAELEGSPQLMIEAWKDSQRRDLDSFFKEAMARAAGSVAAEITTAKRIAVIALPARRSSTRRRGVDLPAMLATACAQRWRAAGSDAVAVPALTMRRAESRGLSARERWRGAQQSMRLSRPVDGTRAVVLVDDVMTTGATLAAARDRLEAAGAVVCAGLTLATAPMRGKSPSVGLGWESEADELSDTFDGRGGD
ncbi:ComF family protein [Demequina oxidasica]|uniref:ComF family protein n=1 Tax=Demequina oxidasica TaxID=676199 RepID=UPI000781ECF3|nr:ComF family protein [Demequina oxidasica]